MSFFWKLPLSTSAFLITGASGSRYPGGLGRLSELRSERVGELESWRVENIGRNT